MFNNVNPICDKPDWLSSILILTAVQVLLVYVHCGGGTQQNNLLSYSEWLNIFYTLPIVVMFCSSEIATIINNVNVKFTKVKAAKNELAYFGC